jgi:hypothetical protein
MLKPSGCAWHPLDRSAEVECSAKIFAEPSDVYEAWRTTGFTDADADSQIDVTFEPGDSMHTYLSSL